MEDNKFDLHTHTLYSDGLGTVKQMIMQAENIGLTGLAITDHDNIQSHKKIRKMKSDLILIPGQEVTTQKGHILALGINELIPKRKSIEETLDLIREQGAVSIAAHPLLPKMGIFDFYKYKFDGFEELNANMYMKRLNKKITKIKNIEKFARIAGTDSHQPLTVGRCYTKIKDVQNVEDVLKRIKQKKTSSSGKLLTKREYYDQMIKTYRKRKNKTGDAGRVMSYYQNFFALLPKIVGYPLFSTTMQLAEILAGYRARKYF